MHKKPKSCIFNIENDEMETMLRKSSNPLWKRRGVRFQIPGANLIKLLQM